METNTLRNCFFCNSEAINHYWGDCKGNQEEEYEKLLYLFRAITSAKALHLEKRLKVSDLDILEMQIFQAIEDLVEIKEAIRNEIGKSEKDYV